MRLVLAGILTAFCLTACGGQATSEEIIEMPEAAEQEETEAAEQDETEAAAQDETETAAPEEEEAAASGETAETPAEQESDTEDSAPAEEGQTSGGLDNFDVGQEEVEAFAEKIKEAVAAQDLEALADLTSFPVYVGVSENGVVETREDFLALGADTVITPELQEAVEGTDVTALSASMAGFTMMTEGVSGSITFSMTADGLAITGINY